ncbi:MAG: hypothetical protein GF334_13820 [Candidatus Altiarchaeales archaeon]|nr:hypothetical protein [Candidatus Altiarchaeales archaeon]
MPKTQNSYTSLEERWDWIISFLVVQDMFVHEVLIEMHKKASKSVDTMGVYVKGSRFYLLYNPDFVRSLSDPELRFVLTHEVYHLILHHCTRRAPADPRRSKMWNLAADLAINSLVVDDNDRHMPKDEKYKGLRPTDEQFKYPEKLSMEQYLQLIDEQFGGQSGNQKCPACGGSGKKSQSGQGQQQSQRGSQGQSQGGSGQGQQDSQDQQGGGGSGQGQQSDKCPVCGGTGQHGDIPSSGFDEHSQWDEDESGMADTMIRNLVDKLSKREKVWGTLSADMQSIIMAAQQAQVSWRKFLRFYLGNLVSTKAESTFKRPNRRFGYPYCGTKRKHVDRKLVAVDTSGSISDDDLAQFLCEVNRLAEIQPVDLVMFDWDIQGKIVPFDRKTKRFKFDGRGGTNFQPVMDLADKHRYSSLIILTDGYASEPTKPVYVKDVLWVIVDGEPPVDWGMRVKITPKVAPVTANAA